MTTLIRLKYFESEAEGKAIIVTDYDLPVIDTTGNPVLLTTDG